MSTGAVATMAMKETTTNLTTSDHHPFQNVPLLHQPQHAQGFGPVVTAAILLRDWGKYGLAERLCYHLGIPDALVHNNTVDKQQQQQQKYDDVRDEQQQQIKIAPVTVQQVNEGDVLMRKNVLVELEEEEAVGCSSGVISLLECVPTKPWHKLTRRQKRDLKVEILKFNAQATAAKQHCHEPKQLPLAFNLQTRLFYAYEMTRVAFVLDASPTLTSTFGSATCTCPMDRFVDMARTFWTGIGLPIPTPTHVWKPEIAVTVLAVFPRGAVAADDVHTKKCTSILVRDFRVTDSDSAELLSAKIEEWCLGEVETEIAKRLAHHDMSYDAGVLPLYQSSMRDLLVAGQVALSTLSSTARPQIVIATDCRSVACDSIIDMVTETNRVDVPVTVLDLSSPTSHYHPSNRQQPPQDDSHRFVGNDNFHWLNYDPVGAMFPLHLSDDAEVIYRLSHATGGAFFDQTLLHEARVVQAGHVADANSVLNQDFFFCFKRHSIQPNAVQWYTLFSLSPLSPILQDTWGRLPPPDYIARRLAVMTELRNDKAEDHAIYPRSHQQQIPYAAVDTMNNEISGYSQVQRKPQARTTFSNYIINPIPINEILLMRVKEGYRIKQYGQSTSEPNRVSIQFVLPLDLGTTIRYELSYKALPGQGTRSVGFAHIKIELIGDVVFISSVKNDFLSSQNNRGRPVTLAQQVSTRLCTHLRWIRKEDLLQSYLSPLRWSDQLSSPDTPFIRRLGTLSSHQRRRHFCLDEFDCVCVGQMPWEDDDFLSEFRDMDDGAQQLTDTIEKWSTQTIENGRCYVRQIHPDCGVAGYCVVEVVRSPMASRLFTIVLETFGGMSAGDRHALLTSLKDTLRPLRAVEILSKQLEKFLVGEKARRQAGLANQFYQKVLESHHNHVSWDLVKDNELIPLLMKRRKEIGKFLLLESGDNHALFAKLYESDQSNNAMDPGNLAQYQFAVLDDKVVVDFHMESEGGAFFPFRPLKLKQHQSKFHLLVRSLKTRDQECGHALRCRTTLLRALNDKNPAGVEETTLTHAYCVQRLLGYASKVSLRLRFFHSDSGAANNILQSLTKDVLLSQSLGAKVSLLPIPIDAIIDSDPGSWFIVKYDKHTMSIVHFSLIEKNEVSEIDGRGCTYRVLTFFTISVSDLYSRRNDVADDESEDDHISEHLQVSEFSEYVLIAHQQNYATSAYIALKSDASECFNFFDLDDFAEVMSTLEFVEVARVLVSEGSTRDHDGTSKLLDLLETVLHPIADEDYCFFYENTDENAMSFPWLDNDSDVDSALGTVSDGPVESDDEESLISNRMEFDIAAEGNSLGFESTELDSSLQNLVPAPIFVRFLLDDKPVSAASLINIDRRSNLAVLVSVFKKESFVLTNSRKVDPAELPLSHQTAALELSALLNAYVAEQTLERLRYLGSKLQEQDFRQAKTCLRQARNIMTSTVDVFFYVAKSDAIVAASAPLVTDIEMYEGFSLLVSVLQKNEVLVLRKLAHGDVFFLEAVEEGSNALACWCVLNIRRALGVVTVEIHHHGGSQKASALMETVLEVVSMCCHRVNQLLLLRVLHGSRTASRLLIPPDLKKPASETLSAGLFIEGPFHDGLFSCPIVYRASFELFHRCAANPAQVARSLEATVMHIFAVSNRRQVFVYKDESGSVFYMRLLFRQGVTDTVLHSGTDGEAQIELLVYGIEDPGPSITQQLRKLLQKRLLLIAVDMLSSVLTKNPQYHWRQPDIIFIRSFQAHWNDIENGYAPSAFNKRRTYAFPPSAYDPGMIILFFRQNICGSTFFHPLSTMEWLPADDCGAVTRVDGTNLHFDATDLVFYYNTSSSKLDPNFQSESTLTAKGAQYARQAGSGIAIVELSLVNGKGQRLQGINAAVPTCKVSSTLNVSAESLRFHDVSGEEYPVNADHKAPAFLRVSVTDTALKSDALHQWILLSVTQVLIAWNMERLLERIQKGLIAPLSVEDPNSTYTGFQAKNWKIENICCGLPAFTGLLETAHGLPHPAALKVQYDGVVRSSAVASVALDLLEKGILDLIWSETKKKLVTDKHFRLNVVRSSRSSKPRRVQFERDSQRKVMVRSYSEKNDRASIIKDSPIDCPEYTIFFYSLDYDPEGRHINEADFPKLFEEVSVGFEKTGDKGESARSLVIFKNNHLPFFRRSFAFIFSVKRNRRTLLAYNWNAQLFNKTATRLQEMDSSFLSSTGESVASLQHRSLGRLAPAYTLKKSPAPMEQLRDSLQQKSSNLSSSSQANRNDLVVIGDRSRPPVPRPTMHSQTIRRPKLVGKSVEGSAIQAVARSRARASSSRFRGGSQPTIIATPKIHNGSLKGGRSPAIRTVTRKSSDPRRLPQGQEMLESPVEGKELRAATKEVEIAVYKQGLVRQSTLRAAAFKNLIRTRWPVRSDQTMSQSLAEYIFAVGYVAWNEVSTMLPLPEKLMDAFLISFGQTLAAWTPGLERVPTMSPNIGVSSFLLMGKTRSVRNCKCFVVVRLSTSTMIVNSDRKVIVLSEGRLLTMPRHSKRVGKGYNSQTIMEHSSTGLDKLSSELHAVLGLQGKLLDHASSIIERTMKSAAGSREYDEVFRVLKRLVETFSLRSLITVRSNYKCYKAAIVLRSYNDRLVDLYDGPTLFQWLSSNLARKNIIKCGASGLCFKREIVVGVTQSICFLSCNDLIPKEMRLDILCRTQGKDLNEFTFRQGSNIAISILGNIAIEAAGLAYKELHDAAASLHKEKLWALLSSTISSSNETPSSAHVTELLDLCSVNHISNFLDNSADTLRFVSIFNNAALIDFTRCCTSMKRDHTFLPSWELAETEGLSSHLFYLASEDLFLLVKGNKNRTGLLIYLVEQEETPAIDNRATGAIQKLANFLLHFLWSETRVS